MFLPLEGQNPKQQTQPQEHAKWDPLDGDTVEKFHNNKTSDTKKKAKTEPSQEESTVDDEHREQTTEKSNCNRYSHQTPTGEIGVDATDDVGDEGGGQESKEKQTQFEKSVAWERPKQTAVICLLLIILQNEPQIIF